jgi:hypothetical protein
MKKTKSRKLVEKAFHEVHEQIPEAVHKTFYKKGAAQADKQLVAIALSKARAKGARIPRRKQ